MSFLSYKLKFSFLVILLLVVAAASFIAPKSVLASTLTFSGSGNILNTSSYSYVDQTALANVSSVPIYYSYCVHTSNTVSTTGFSFSVQQMVSGSPSPVYGYATTNNHHDSTQTCQTGSFTFQYGNITAGSSYRLMFSYGSGGNSGEVYMTAGDFFEIAGFPADFVLGSTQTRIVSITPANGSTFCSGCVGETSASTTQPFVFSVDTYINSDDVFTFDIWGNTITNPLRIVYNDPDLQMAFSSIIPPNPVIVGEEDYAFSTTTTLTGYQTFTWTLPQEDFISFDRLKEYAGRHTSTAKIIDPSTFLWVWDTSSDLAATSSTWTFAHLSGKDLLKDDLASTTAANHASTTLSLLTCNILGGNFSFGSCFDALVKPDPMEIKVNFDIMLQTLGSSWPIGYFTDFVSIIKSEATTTLPAISATIPQGVAGAGAHIDLALTPHMLDYLWYATTSQFINESATSTDTLFDIVSFYWNKVVYLLLIIYILSRLVGFHLFGGMVAGEGDEEWKPPLRDRFLTKKQFNRKYDLD